jgi:hypothetical protein
MILKRPLLVVNPKHLYKGVIMYIKGEFSVAGCCGCGCGCC